MALDPDLWNDDGTAKAPTQERMDALEELQQGEQGVFINFARIKRDARSKRAPEVGDIVHAWDGTANECRAAMVTETGSFDHNAELNVFIPRGVSESWHAIHIEGDERLGYEEGCWHWPCGEGQ